MGNTTWLVSVRRLTGALVLAVVAAGAAAGPATAAPAGKLTQVSPPDGCVAATSLGVGCTVGRGLDLPAMIKLSPGGAHAYVPSFFSDGVATFTRDDDTGVLTQRAGTSGCILQAGDGATCADGRGLNGAAAVDVSPDGTHVYAAARVSKAVTVFARDASTGALTQVGCIADLATAGSEGCSAAPFALGGANSVSVSADGEHVYVGSFVGDQVSVFDRDTTTGALSMVSCVNAGGFGGCAAGRGLGQVFSVLASADGENVYATAFGSDAVAVFGRDATTGALTQLPGTDGCLAETGDDVTCADGIGLDGTHDVQVSPDGATVYVASNESDAITAYDRDGVTGALRRSSCVSNAALAGCDATAAGIDGAQALAISPGGENLYAGAVAADAVSAFTRADAGGALTQLPGTAACISETGSGGACEDGVGLDSLDWLTVSFDGRFGYATAAASDAITVYERGARPSASFAASPNPADVGQTVSFDGSASADADGTVVRYEWDLDGDATFETDTGSSAIATRSYATAGTRTVTLRVTDGDGNTGTATNDVQINAPSSITLPADFADEPVADVDFPTALAFTPDGRLLITSQLGQLRVMADETLLPTAALDLSSRVCTNIERGLSGVAVDPAFAVNRFIYLYYTLKRSSTCPTTAPETSAHPVNRLSRFTLGLDSIVDPASELVLLDNIPSPSGQHNAGDLQFGKDGYLYVTVGDGGCDYAGGGCAGNNDAARDPHVLLGKVLRITRDGGIPDDNPFQGADSGRCNLTGRTDAGKWCQETFASGLRNPFRFAFDPDATSTRFRIGDVGQNTWEEIDEGASGVDYGWNRREGPCATGSSTNCGPPPEGLTNPIYSYNHSTGCKAVTGSAFVPTGAWSEAYDGAYLFGDYVCGKIFRLVPSGDGFTTEDFATGLGVGSAVHLRMGPRGTGQALYYTSFAGTGEVRRIAFTGAENRTPNAEVTATPRAGPTPLDVTFDGSASSDADTGDTLTYEWDFGDGSAPVQTTTATTAHTYAVDGDFTATLRVRDASGAVSAPATVTIAAGDIPPVPAITAPTTEERFAVGQPITLRGTATDAEDGTLADSALSWRVILHHNEHTHPFLAPTTGNAIPFDAPPPEDIFATETSYLEIFLTATDSRGVSTTVSQRFDPRLVPISFATEPSGLNVEVNGTSFATPIALTSWEAYALDVVAPAQSGYVFDSWSDGGAASHRIITPPAATTYTATFRRSDSAYRSAVLGSAGLVSYWRLGESAGTVAADETGANAGSYLGGVSLGAAGALVGDPDSAARFDGLNDEMSVTGGGLALGSSGSLEGWFDVSSGAVLRDHTRVGGWILAFDSAGKLAYRVGGTTFVTAREFSTLAGGWRHVVATKSGGDAALYVDGELVHAGSGAGSTVAKLPWHVMRNGDRSEFTVGGADEVAIYGQALSAATVGEHYQAGIGGSPPPPPPPDSTPPAAPSGVSANAGDASVALNWADSAESDLAGYDVYRATVAGGPYAKVNASSLTESAFSDGGLVNGTAYFYVVRAVDTSGNASVDSAEVSATPQAAAPSAYRSGVLGTPGLVSYWRLGESAGSVAADEVGVNAGSYLGGPLLGQAGALVGDPDSAARFDGLNDEMSVTGGGLALGSSGSLEGWFDVSSGVVLRDHTSVGGWILAFDSGGKLAYRVGGTTFVTDRAFSTLGGGWRHVVATKSGSSAALYVDGELVHSGAGAKSTVAKLPWHVMRNGDRSEFTVGGADEVAIYNTALSAATIGEHYQAGVGGSPPPPPDSTPPAAPSGVSANAGDASVALNWADNAESDLAGYDVYRATVAGGPYAKVNASLSTASEYVDGGLVNGTAYFYVVRAVDTSGNASVDSAEVSATPQAAAPSAYRSGVLGTPGLVSYWRLGESVGSVAADETGANAGSFVGGVSLGAAGALVGDPDSAARFDGLNDEMSVSGAGLGLGSSGSLEGWFDVSSGVALMRDESTKGGWILAFDSAGKLAYRVGGTTFVTAREFSTLAGGWRHVVATKSGGDAALYVDGELVHAGTGAGSTAAKLPWHVMRNGTYDQLTAGGADEIAIYDQALSATAVQEHYQAGTGA